MCLRTTAIAAFAGALGLAAAAQESSMPGQYSGFVSDEDAEQLLSADEVMDAELYTMNAAYGAEEWSGSDLATQWQETDFYESVGPNWERIGDIDDIIVSRDGRLIGVVAEVGGWLDIGDSEVLIDLRDLKVVAPGGDIGFVTRLSRAMIEGMDEVDEGWF